jgi:hypothetical protein
LHILHWGAPKGLRPSINAAVEMAKGDYLFKLDAHCALMEGYDVALAKECGDNEVVVPAKHSLEPVTWMKFREPWQYFYLMWPWQQQPDDTTKFVGLQDRNYGPDYNAPREALRVDDILSYQGSAWMLRRSHWNRIVPKGMDAEFYYYAQEPQEIGLTTWVTGGRVKIVKDVWYAHLHKGKGEHKRRFMRLKTPWDTAMERSARFWLGHPGFPALIEKFGPLPGWPADWEAEAHRQWRTRP